MIALQNDPLVFRIQILETLEVPAQSDLAGQVGQIVSGDSVIAVHRRHVEFQTKDMIDAFHHAQLFVRLAVDVVSVQHLVQKVHRMPDEASKAEQVDQRPVKTEKSVDFLLSDFVDESSQETNHNERPIEQLHCVHSQKDALNTDQIEN